jgi:DNA ligase-1
MLGKNINKSNETTPFQQAVDEAKSKWNKKKDKGYAPENSTEDVSILPMLALEFSKRSHDISFPCFIQPKLDGVRCIYSNGRLTSRMGKTFPHLEHIVNELDTSLILDGELYSDTLNFQEVVGLVRRVTLKKGDEELMKQIKFMVFDVVQEKAPFEQRFVDLQKFFKTELIFSKLLQTDICSSEDKVSTYLVEYETSGYEGIILRNKLGEYKKTHRSKDLQKLKTFIDAEYPIIGFAEGEGLEKGCVIWECETSDKLAFHVRPVGTREDRMEYFTKGFEFIGKTLTVKYQELTNDGKPRFPVGLSIRDYE